MHGKDDKTPHYSRQLIEAMPEGFLNLTPTGKILDVNGAYCRMSGYDRDSLIGMDVHGSAASNRRQYGVIF